MKERTLATHPLTVSLTEVKRKRPTFYDTLTVDLSTARTGLESEAIPKTGDFLGVETISGTNIGIAFNEPTNPRINLNLQRIFVTPFDRIFIFNTAQTGKSVKFNVGRDAAFNAQPLMPVKIADIDGNERDPASEVTTPTKYAVAVTLADTEYSQLLPVNTRRFRIHLRDVATFRLAYVTGKVAASTDPYETIPAGAEKAEDFVRLAATTLYFASPVALKTAEIEVWT